MILIYYPNTSMANAIARGSKKKRTILVKQHPTWFSNKKAADFAQNQRDGTPYDHALIPNKTPTIPQMPETTQRLSSSSPCIRPAKPNRPTMVIIGPSKLNM